MLGALLAFVPAKAHGENGGALLGAAAIAGVASGIAISGIQAGADKDIAAINANAQMTMTNRQATASENIAGIQSQTALGLSAIAAQTSLINNQGVTQRLGMQLTEQADARRLEAQLDAIRTAEEFRLANRKLDLEEKMADVKAAIARLTAGVEDTTLAPASLAVRSYGVAQASGQVSTAAGDTSSRLLASLDTPTASGQGIAGIQATVSGGAPRGLASISQVASVGTPTQGTPEWTRREARALYAQDGAEVGTSGGHRHGNPGL
ncbi:hypothetical protein K2X33_07825 [bacterium]|nr:hypothetical protein [bacterium]